MYYLAHSTDVSRSQKIIRTRNLDPNAKPRMLDDDAKRKKRVFMYVLSKLTVPQRCTATFFGKVTFIFSSEIMRDQQGTMGDIGSFDDKSVKRYVSKGNVLDLDVFQQKIHDKIDKALTNKNRDCSVLGFMHSHEITLENTIDLDRNLKAVLACDAETHTTVEGYMRKSKKLMNIPCIDVSKMTYMQIIKAVSKF